jgi:quercetin dioxygenase-like cupin family protein
MSCTDRPQATSRLQIDNVFARVTEWRFAPHAETGWHRHALDYVVAPMTTGRLLIIDADGQRHSSLRVGECYARPAGVEHNVINDNPFEFVFIEIEVKNRPSLTSGVP